MPSRILKLFRSSPLKGTDGLTQPQREAIADLLHLCLYADSHIGLSEDAALDRTLEKFDWDPKVAFETFEAGSISRARDARENPAARQSLLASVRARLDSPATRARALAAAQQLLNADGTHPRESTLAEEIKRALE